MQQFPNMVNTQTIFFYYKIHFNNKRSIDIVSCTILIEKQILILKIK